MMSLKKEDRIYDTLAQIFSGYAECAAVVKIGEKIYFSANELKRSLNKGGLLIVSSVTTLQTFLTFDDSKPSSKPATSSEVQDKFEAFLSLKYKKSKNKYTKKFDVLSDDEKEKVIFKELIYPIGRPKRTLKAASSIYTSKLHEHGVKQAFNANSGMILSYNETKKFFGHNVGMANFSSFEAIAQLNNFRKIIQYCQEHSDFKNHLKKAEPVIDIKDDKKSTTSTNEDSKKNKIVHAEMKILGVILNSLNLTPEEKGLKFYIGISKACCFNCHHTLEASKETLKKYGITLNYRGYHDVSSESKWQYPEILRPTSFTENEKKGKLLADIKRLAQAKFKIFKPSKDVSQGHSKASESDSEVQKIDAYSQYLISWQDTLKKKEIACGLSEDDKKTLDMISVGLKLLKINSIKEIFEYPAGTKVEDFTRKQREFFMVKNQIGCEKEILVSFLKNPDYCGKILCNYFSDVDFDTLLKPKIISSKSISFSSSSTVPTHKKGESSIKENTKEKMPTSLTLPKPTSLSFPSTAPTRNKDESDTKSAKGKMLTSLEPFPKRTRFALSSPTSPARFFPRTKTAPSISSSSKKEDSKNKAKRMDGKRKGR